MKAFSSPELWTAALRWAALLTLSATALSQEPLHFPSVPPVPPEKAEATIEAMHGFHMQLLAAEPLVTSPVAITYDENGRAFVCEMNDYPYTDKAHHKANQENPQDNPIGKIRMLVDSQGKGVFDKSTIYAQGLSWPTGAACWKGGIIVVATPDIWYFKDTKGDGVADVKQKLFTGLRKFNVQAVANNPIWGLDNKLYIAGGSNGGELHNLVHPEEKPLVIRRADLVIDPVKMTIEAASGGARFGNSLDDWGNRFLCNIRNPLEHVVLAARYLSRNPYLPPTIPLADVAESGDQLPVYRISPPEAWREYRAKRWSADPSITAHMPRSELVGSGVVTSSSGVTIYRGDAYPPEYRNMAFVADVAGNLFYRLKLTPRGLTFTGARIDGKREFVASRDIWFRPVNFTNAPDGCLHVCDMYREVIEHPWSLPDDIHAALDLENGRDKGRLYRLAPPGFTPRKLEALGGKTTAELVALLGHPNAWHSDTARRLLFERQDKSAAPLLHDMLEKDPNPLARLHALWALEGLASLEKLDLLRALQDTDDHVRANAIIAAEPYVKQDSAIELAVTRNVRSSSLAVRTRVALSLGGSGPKNARWLSQLLVHDLADRWMQTAILSAEPDLVQAVAEAACGSSRIADGPELAGFIQAASTVVGRQNLDAACVEHLKFLAGLRGPKPKAAEAGLLGLATGLTSKGKTPLDFAHEDWVKSWLADVADESAKTALDGAAPVEARTAAVSMLTLEEFSQLQFFAAQLLLPVNPDAVRVAVIKLLSRQRQAKVADLLLAAWPSLTPAPREAALQAFAGRPTLTDALLTALEKGSIKPSEISPTARTLLSRLSNAALRDRAAKLFVGTASRQQAIAKYQNVLTLKGDAAKGHAVYAAICAACHRKGEEGRDIGPNLATVQSWTPSQILVNVLDPNREVAPNFVLYIVETNDGRTLSGLITNETAASLSLKGPDGVEQSVSRAEVKTLKSTGLSLMPEGLEAAITPQQMADVIAFVRGGS